MSEYSGDYHESYRQPWPKKTTRKAATSPPAKTSNSGRWVPVDRGVKATGNTLTEAQRYRQIETILKDDLDFQKALVEFTTAVYGVVQLYQNRIVVDLVSQSTLDSQEAYAVTEREPLQYDHLYFVKFDGDQKVFSVVSDDRIQDVTTRRFSDWHYSRDPCKRHQVITPGPLGPGASS